MPSQKFSIPSEKIPDFPEKSPIFQAKKFLRPFFSRQLKKLSFLLLFVVLFFFLFFQVHLLLIMAPFYFPSTLLFTSSFPSSVCRPTSFPLPWIPKLSSWIPPIIPIPSFCVVASSYLIFFILFTISSFCTPWHKFYMNILLLTLILNSLLRFPSLIPSLRFSHSS